MTQPSPTHELEQAAAAALAGEFESLVAVGMGATAVVFRGVRVADGVTVAVKVLRPEIASGLEGERFLREIAIESRLEHPGIVPVISWGRADGLVYAVMTWEGGETLRDRLESQGQLPVDEAARIALELADALGYAHEHGIVHRDVKPENVLLSSGHARLLDFGIARALTQAVGERLTHTGVAIGTPTYMSPEQAAADRLIDARSDEYSLACVFYEMLTGDPPFSGRTAQAIIARHLGEAAPSARVVRPTVPASVDAVLLRALAKSAADRYASLGEFAAALTLSLTPGARAAVPARTRRRWAGAALAIGAVAIAAVALWPRTAPLDENKIVIYPLVDSRSVPEADAGWSAAIAIEASLEHAMPLRGLDGWTLLPAAARADPRKIVATDAIHLARRAGARYLVTGAIARMGDSLSVSLRLYDVAADSLVAQESARGSERDAVVPQLGIRATRALLPKLLAGGRAVDLPMLEGRAPSAIALWLNGERAYRRSEFMLAREMLERAVGEDSLLVVAAIRGAQAASWETDLGGANSLLAVAAAHADRLPPRYKPLIAGLQAYVRGDADSARNALRLASSLDANWLEPKMALGEVYYHLSPSDGTSDSTALALFEAVAQADTGFAPPLTHLAEAALRAGRLERADDLLGRMARLRPTGGPPARLQLMRACVAAPSKARWSEWVAADSVWTVLYAGRLLAVGGAQPACAEGAFRTVLTARDVPVSISWGALLELQGLLLAERRYDELRTLLDSTAATGNTGARLLYVLDGMAGAPTMAQGAATAALARQLFGATYGTAKPQSRWVLALWHAARGDLAMVETIAVSLDSLARATGGRHERLVAAAVAAHLSLARHDTVQALARFRALHANAARDSLQWSLFESLAVERLTLARLLSARREYAEAYRVAQSFDQEEPIMNLPYLGESLRIREAAARALGRRDAAAEARARLKLLDDERMKVVR